jgi:hypothetical protein
LKAGATKRKEKREYTLAVSFQRGKTHTTQPPVLLHSIDMKSGNRDDTRACTLPSADYLTAPASFSFQ